MIVFALLLSCTQKPPAPPALPTPSASAVFAADLTGNGTTEIVSVDQGELHWNGRSASLEGSVSSHAVVDLDGDGQQELVLAVGRSRSHPKAEMRVWIVDAEGHTVHGFDAHPRHRITDLSAFSNRVFLTMLGPKKRTVGGWWSPDGFVPVTSAIMGLSQAPLGSGAVAVGRLYGDEPRSHGQLEIHRPDADPQVLASVRGVRDLVAADVNQDGHLDLLTSDGWHFRYGQDAEARLNAYYGPEFTEHSLIGTIPANYTINEIQVVRARSPSVIATGNKAVFQFARDGSVWTPIQLAMVSEGSSVAIASARKAAWLVVPGNPAQMKVISMK